MGMIPIDSTKPSHDSRVTVRSLFYPGGYHWIPRHLRVFHQKCLKSPASFSTWVLQMQGKINTSDWGNGLQEENRWQVLNSIVIFFKFKRVQTRNQLVGFQKNGKSGFNPTKMHRIPQDPPGCQTVCIRLQNLTEISSETEMEPKYTKIKHRKQKSSQILPNGTNVQWSLEVKLPTINMDRWKSGGKNLVVSPWPILQNPCNNALSLTC